MIASRERSQPAAADIVVRSKYVGGASGFVPASTVTGILPARKLSGLGCRIPVSCAVGPPSAESLMIAWQALVPGSEPSCRFCFNAPASQGHGHQLGDRKGSPYTRRADYRRSTTMLRRLDGGMKQTSGIFGGSHGWRRYRYLTSPLSPCSMNFST